MEVAGIEPASESVLARFLQALPGIVLALELLPGKIIPEPAPLLFRFSRTEQAG